MSTLEICALFVTLVLFGNKNVSFFDTLPIKFLLRHKIQFFYIIAKIASLLSPHYCQILVNFQWPLNSFTFSWEKRLPRVPRCNTLCSLKVNLAWILFFFSKKERKIKPPNDAKRFSFLNQNLCKPFLINKINNILIFWRPQSSMLRVHLIVTNCYYFFKRTAKRVYKCFYYITTLLQGPLTLCFIDKK